MDLLAQFVDSVRNYLPFLLTVFLVIVVLGVTNRVLKSRWKNQPDAQFHFQLIMLLMTFVGMLFVVVALPVDEALRNQLLSLIGVLLSAAIALSSTTFIGNIMAGIMLKVIRSARPGDFITIGNLTGRITEMDLLHTEVQTEFRDLVTVPNLTMVTQPLQVVRASGTIVTTEVSLGYDLPQAVVREHLCNAAEAAGLKDAFAHVRELGDFSVTYRVAGLLEEVQSLISARARLRASVLDTLHAADMEIMSPNFMVTRASNPEESVIPPLSRLSDTPRQPAADDIAFDKANEAASIEALRNSLAQVEEQLTSESSLSQTPRRERLEGLKSQIQQQLREAEANKSKD